LLSSAEVASFGQVLGNFFLHSATHCYTKIYARTVVHFDSRFLARKVNTGKVLVWSRIHVKSENQ